VPGKKGGRGGAASGEGAPTPKPVPALGAEGAAEAIAALGIAEETPPPKPGRTAPGKEGCRGGAAGEAEAPTPKPVPALGAEGVGGSPESIAALSIAEETSPSKIFFIISDPEERKTLSI
jgi:hypothetical protein